MSAKENYTTLLQHIPSQVTLVAVSKTHPASAIKEVYDAGCRHFGENKVQELVSKQQSLPNDINWHLIGHLQTNKVKFIVPFVHLIHSIDSIKLLLDVDKEAKKINRSVNCLLQCHIASEETKFGFSQEEILCQETIRSIHNLQHVTIRGVMGMASFTDDESTVRKEFGDLKAIYDHLKGTAFNTPTFDTISMGMSGDYNIAIEKGSTMIRVGTTIFGTRDYSL